MRDRNGDTVSPADVLNADELRELYAQRDRGPARGFHAPRRPDRHDGDYVSRSDGQWAYEPYSGEAS